MKAASVGVCPPDLSGISYFIKELCNSFDFPRGSDIGHLFLYLNDKVFECVDTIFRFGWLSRHFSVRATHGNGRQPCFIIVIVAVLWAFELLVLL